MKWLINPINNRITTIISSTTHLFGSIFIILLVCSSPPLSSLGDVLFLHLLLHSSLFHSLNSSQTNDCFVQVSGPALHFNDSLCIYLYFYLLLRYQKAKNTQIDDCKCQSLWLRWCIRISLFSWIATQASPLHSEYEVTNKSGTQ